MKVRGGGDVATTIMKFCIMEVYYVVFLIGVAVLKLEAYLEVMKDQGKYYQTGVNLLRTHKFDIKWEKMMDIR